ncbi:hypothetical protein PAPYR_7394 [Paratrimastix pyriformis]|uniref:Uncharacterized protein n=1 Tax=Paratrimastix pyriformis TaxID=342808 RepID=A0ABQ8UEN7_9EUKA|nr:hypothetical protein PAPYR_7394 [Paratrimastix pyriformis]
MMPRQAPGYEVRCSPLLNRTYDFFQPEDKTEVHLSRQAFYERIFPKLLASWFPNTNHLNPGLIVPVHFLKPLTEYHFSAPICVELHKVLTRMVLAFGGVLFSLTSGRCSDTSQTYRGLSARALLITLLLDSEAAFDIDHPVEGPMRLDEIVLWERSYPFYLRGVLRDRSLLERTDYYGEQFPKVFLACEREYLSLSADERKTYDWSIQCHKFRTSTCARELPTLWDFLLTGPLPLPVPVLVAEPEPVPESVPLPENVPVADDDEDEWLDVFSRKKEEEVLPGNRYTMSRQKFATILLPSKIRSMKPEAFVSPLPNLPRLRNILNFEECVRFEDTISQTIGSIDGLPVDLRQLVPPSAVGILLRYNQHCFDSCEDLFDSLYDISRPKSNFLRTRHLASLVFSPPPTFVDGLKFPAEAAAKLFLKSFRGFFGDMVKDEFLVGCAASPSSDDDSSSSSSEDEKPAPSASATSVPATSGSDPAGSAGVAKTPAEQAAQELAALDQETELHRAVERVRDLAQRLDEAAALHLSRGVTTAPRPVFGHSFGHGRHREHAFAGRVPFQPPTPSPPATASVPPHPTSRGSVERSRLRDQGLCTWCHSSGHAISDCPGNDHGIPGRSRYHPENNGAPSFCCGHHSMLWGSYHRCHFPIFREA